MTTKNNHSVRRITPIILAGGLSSRFGPIGKYIPKSIFPILDTSLLLEQVKNLAKAGFKKIIISCRPEHFSIITDVVKTKDKKMVLTIIPNKNHNLGPITALSSLNYLVKEYVLVVLADIFFKENPFVENLNLNTSEQGITLLVSKAKRDDYKQGGLVALDKKYGYRIVESPSVPIQKSYRWCGSVLLSKKALSNLEKYTRDGEILKMGNYYNNLTEDGFEFSLCNVPNFINMNTPEHLIKIVFLLKKKNN